MTDQYQSSDKVKSVTNRQLGFNVIEKALFINGLQDAGNGYWVGTASLDLSQFNFNTLVPEFSVTMTKIEEVDGPEPGENYYYVTQMQLPFCLPHLTGVSDGIGRVGEEAHAQINYESNAATVKDDVTYGTSQLTVVYYLRNWNGLGLNLRFDVKIKGSDSITAEES